MPRVSVFSAPFLLGFDAFEERIDRMAKSADGYPPYNIERLPASQGAEHYQITIAVAGFCADELEITSQNSQLLVRGRKRDDKSREFLHQGIATRQFQRSFLLADGMKVLEAELRDGMLMICAERPQVDHAARKIEIREPQREPQNANGRSYDG